jgi:hypothetical protein
MRLVPVPLSLSATARTGLLGSSIDPALRRAPPALVFERPLRAFRQEIVVKA